MDNSRSKNQLKQTLLGRQRRLQTLINVDVPIFEDVDTHIGTDIARRLEAVLEDYKLTLDQWLEELDEADAA
jgi:hypothetical protein